MANLNPTYFDPRIFGEGFNASIAASYCVVARLVNDDVLNMDGTIDRRIPHNGLSRPEFDRVKLKHLWLYIYYLWENNNNHIDLFRSMNDGLKRETAASADAFIDKVTQFLQANGYVAQDPLTKENLADFIDLAITKHNDKIKIPFLEGIYRRVTAQQLKYNDFIEEDIVRLGNEVETYKRQAMENVPVKEVDFYSIKNDGEMMLLKPKQGDPIKINFEVIQGGRKKN
jgi:hypothetical protein